MGRSKRGGFFHAFGVALLAFLLTTPFPAGSLAGQKLHSRGEGGAGTTAPSRERKEADMAEKNDLSQEDGKYLLGVARKTIDDRLFGRKTEGDPDEGRFPRCSERRGTFVTLTMDGNLRGCIGHIIPQESLVEGVRVNAVNAAFRDPRFRPLSRQEWGRTKIEVSVLTEPKSLPYTDGEDLLRKLRPGVDGVILKKGYNQATFLPQVWEQLPDKKEFLTHLCLKAGLDGHAWKKEKLEVSVYQVQAFHED
ncbi:MAG: AmmeMemoRadiSam system protein A [Thermodesulfobacteriota bacterium]